MDAFKFLSNLTSLWHLVSLTTSSVLKVSLSLGFTVLTLSLPFPTFLFLSLPFKILLPWTCLFLDPLFSWRIAALQCRVAFCCTRRSISSVDTYTSVPLLHPTRLGGLRASWPPCVYGGSSLALSFTRGRVCMSVPTSQFITHTPRPHHVHNSTLYVGISLPALQIGSSVPFF